MAINRSDPMRELLALQQKMNHLFETTISHAESGEPEEGAVGSWTPAVDIYEGDDRIALRMDIPGVRREDIEVRVENHTLTVRGERRLDPDMRREDFLRMERSFGAFTRTFSLPPVADPGGIRAEMKDGTLEITISKRADPQGSSHKVEVR